MPCPHSASWSSRFRCSAWATFQSSSRSSDAIAVAVRAQAPIFAADAVIEESAIEFEGEDVNEEEIVDEFKRFLDRVSAEDFAEADVEEEDDA